MKYFSFLLASVLFIISCKNPDEGSPVVDLIQINGDAVMMHGIAGMPNSMRLRLSDDKELSQVKWRFITPSGFHMHEETGSQVYAFKSPNLGVWDTMHIENIGSREAELDFVLNIPDTISGGWKLEVTVLDKNGNLTTKNAVLNIQNDKIPVIIPDETIPAVSSDGIIHLHIGDSLRVTGSIIDIDTLQSVSAVMAFNGSETWSNHWDNVNDWKFDLEEMLPPPFTANGTYTFTIYATNRYGRDNWQQATIKVE